MSQRKWWRQSEAREDVFKWAPCGCFASSSCSDPKIVSNLLIPVSTVVLTPPPPSLHVTQLQLRGLQGHLRLADGPDGHPTHSGHRVRLGPRRAGWHIKGPGRLQLQGHPQLSAEHRWVRRRHTHTSHLSTVFRSLLVFDWLVCGFFLFCSARACRTAGVRHPEGEAMCVHAGAFPLVRGLPNPEGVCVFEFEICLFAIFTVNSVLLHIQSRCLKDPLNQSDLWLVM